MGLIGSWTRQVAQAAGVSLLAPIVLLVAAAAVAVGGNGFGGIGSLGQLASGPALPDTGELGAPEAGLGGDAPIVALDGGGAFDPGNGAAARSGGGPVELADRPAAGGGPPGSPTPPAERGGPGIRTPAPPAPTGARPGPSPPAAEPVPGPAGGLGGTLEEGPLGGLVRGIGESVPEPLRGITDPLVDLLLGTPTPSP